MLGALAAALCAATLFPQHTRASTVPSGFQDEAVFSGLTNPTQVQFASDGRVFVAEKSGLIKVFDGLSDTTPTVFADLRTNVHNFWDRGLLGLALDPQFPTRPYVYALYTYDAAMGGTAPRWGTAGATSDGCPTPPGPTTDGCVVSARLSRLTADGDTMSGPENVLINDWCQQYPSHSIGDLDFGQDGALYVSAGDGASFDYADYGQSGNPVNPCGDAPGAPGTALTPPTAEGGALRAQDVRTQGSTGGGGGTTILRPDSDVTSQWVVGGTGATSAWDALNDNVTQPTDVPVEQFMFEGVQNKVTEVGFGSTQLTGTPSAGKAWFYGDVGPGTTIRVDAIWGGAVHGSTTVQGGADGAPYSWRFVDVVPPTQAAVDDLRLRFTVTTGSDNSADMFAAYFELQTSAGTSSDPTSLDGALLRVDPDTGAAMPDNPLASSADPNARRIVAYGFRNPFRFTVRPGTNEIWAGDVGWGTWEEIDRIANPSGSSAQNFGWPCYEGGERQSGYDVANLNLCESLYASGGVSAPYYAYDHDQKVVAGETCATGSSSISGMAFYPNGPFPDSYDGALFFADYSRGCIWAMPATGGLPDPSKLLTFATAADPVELTYNDGYLYYPSFDGGQIRRIGYTVGNQAPTASIQASSTSGAAPLTVNFNGTGSTDPENQALTYAWDLDGDGQYDDSTAASPSFTYTQAGSYTVRLRVTDPGGLNGTATTTITVGNSPPVANIVPPAASLKWRVGQAISFSGSATDAQDGQLPASAYSWDLEMEHCPSNCHVHPIQTFSGTSGSFSAPDHEYPSNLLLTLTVTDSGGLQNVQQIRLSPQTALLTMKSSPTRLRLGVNATSATTTFSRTVILGSANSISAPSPQKKSGRCYRFSHWSDGGASSHNITANASATYTATFTRTSSCTLSAKHKKKKKKKKKHKKHRAA